MLDFGKFWYTWKFYGAGDFKRLKVAKNINFGSVLVDFTEASVSRCSSKWMFIKISQIPQENTSVGVQHSCFPVKFMKFLKTSFLQNTFDGCLWSYGNHWKKASDKERLKVWENDECEWHLLITAELSESCLI